MYHMYTSGTFLFFIRDLGQIMKVRVNIKLSFQTLSVGSHPNYEIFPEFQTEFNSSFAKGGAEGGGF